ncbi:hypothetical protein GUITHDRAFT_153645 [Guillardia theta CCMP2712]|uniref:Uncharacterized protein n=1 Tax=Guillardia theta (strain CCMP2712) TaxID=905079 RepID=L1J0Z9_GUITC|nr:hypothetical protein GUITHDRAFT_153645 [Guillardia theta CCMP2712]EKX41992.1 hypothetical protein GUITHDRAFT_153645 [Guillardia theta CCMP2712]|eukprot:XP_005828972.1 hypothetical protein GUITHDRAFT_153645 [Guillardia theta CCMP2712]
MGPTMVNSIKQTTKKEETIEVPTTSARDRPFRLKKCMREPRDECGRSLRKMNVRLSA